MDKDISLEDLDFLTDEKIKSLVDDKKSMEVLYKRYAQEGQSMEDFRAGVWSSLRLMKSWQIVKSKENK